MSFGNTFAKTIEKIIEPNVEKPILEQKEQQLIERYVEKNLTGEERIKEPMDPECEVSLVIPAYGEREYFLTSLESLAEQKDVKPNQFEVIFVVNNPSPDKSIAKEPHESREQYKRKKEHFHKALVENQETLEIINLINGGSPKADLSNKEKTIVDKIIISGIKVRAIDKASQGRTLPQEKANVGGARNRGVAEAVARFYELKKNGIVAQSDADTRFTDDYITSLIETFKERPKLIGLAGKIQFENNDPNDHLFYRVAVFDEMVYCYNNLIELYLTNEDDGGKPAFNSINFSGANMASRAYEAAIVDGVPEVSGGEDPQFGFRLAEIGEVDHVPTVKTFPADRFSARTDVDAGHGQKKFGYTDSYEKLGTIMVESLDYLRFSGEMRERLEILFKEKAITEKEIKKAYEYKGNCIISDAQVISLAEKFKQTTDMVELLNDFEVIEIKLAIRNKLEELFPKITIEKAIDDEIKLYCQDDVLKAKYELELARAIEEDNGWVERRSGFVNDYLDKVYSETDPIGAERAKKLCQESMLAVGFNQEEAADFENGGVNFRSLLAIIQSTKDKEEAKERIFEKYQPLLVYARDDVTKMRFIQVSALTKVATGKQ